MYAAIKAGDADTVHELIRTHPDLLFERPFMGDSWLHTAADCTSIEVIDALLDAGLDVNVLRRGGEETPLSYAVSLGTLETTKHFLRRGANPNLDRQLIGAINREDDSLSFVKLLVEHGVDVNQCWRFGEDEPSSPVFNALSWAIAAEKDEVVQYLRAHGAVMPEETGQLYKKAPATTRELVLAFFEQKFGKPQAGAFTAIVSAEADVQFGLIPATPGRDYQTLFTIGMSEQLMKVPRGSEDFRYAELVMHLPSDWPLDKVALKQERYRWPLVWLNKIARYPHTHQTWLGGAIALLSNGDPPRPLAAGCPFKALLLAAQYDQVGVIQCDDQRVIQVYTLIPLYQEERQLEISQGLPELFRRMDRAGVGKVVNLQRANVAVSS